MMYLAFLRGQTSFTAAPEMIVVRADNDRFVFKSWIRAIENADDVPGGNFLAHDIRGQRY